MSQVLKNLSAMTKQKKVDYSATRDVPEFFEYAEHRKRNLGRLQIAAGISMHILELLEEKRWTKAKLARHLHVKPQQLSKIWSGDANPSLKTISKLQDVLGVKLIALRFAFDGTSHAVPAFKPARLQAHYPNLTNDTNP